MKPEEKLRQERLDKLEALRDRGINPYPYRWDPTHDAATLLETYSDLDDEDVTDDAVSVAGRIMLKREFGKIAFYTIQDESGQIQLFLKHDRLDDYDILEHLDKGDYIGVTGVMCKTKKGEVSVLADDLKLLTKSLRSPPEQHYGLKDTETRYRKRYLDLLMNEETRTVFRKRSQIIRSMQHWLDERGFIEVETPILQPVYGGANARPFITHHNSLDADMYLRISDELYLKRLIIGGFERVYEIGKDFRNEGIDSSHNPEFTMLEWYMAYGDYEDGMEMFEALISHCAAEINGSTTVEWNDHTIDLSTPWERLTMQDAIEHYAGVDVRDMGDDELRTYCQTNGIDYEPDYPRGLLIEAIFEHSVEDELIQPTFITDFPEETTPLCKQLRDGDDTFVERFEPYIAGMEVGNAYSELNDPQKQREQFEAQRDDDDEAHPVDDDFIEALEHGMPPTSGVGVGVDRIVMLLTGQESIRDVILFPTLKQRYEDDE